MSLQTTADDAQLVLDHATQRGIAVPPGDVNAILKVLRANGAAPAQQEEADFWAAFARLTKAASPATVASLKATMQRKTARTFIFFGPKKEFELAQEAVRRYRMWAITAVVLLAFVQIYAFVGSTLVQSIPKLRDDQADAKEKYGIRRNELIEQQKPGVRDPKLARLEAAELTIGEDLEASYALLQSWNDVWRSAIRLPSVILAPVRRLTAAVANESDVEASSIATSSRAAGNGAVEDDMLALTRAQVALYAVQTILVPLCFGWVGACAYILRRLSGEITAVTYSSVSESAYKLRMPLGALAGMAIGFFIVYDPSSPQAAAANAGSVSLRTSLSAGALAFLAGYSVELLFAVMDSIIGAFSTPKS